MTHAGRGVPVFQGEDRIIEQEKCPCPMGMRRSGEEKRVMPRHLGTPLALERRTRLGGRDLEHVMPMGTCRKQPDKATSRAEHSCLLLSTKRPFRMRAAASARPAPTMPQSRSHEALGVLSVPQVSRRRCKFATVHMMVRAAMPEGVHCQDRQPPFGRGTCT